MIFTYVITVGFVIRTYRLLRLVVYKLYARFRYGLENRVPVRFVKHTFRFRRGSDRFLQNGKNVGIKFGQIFRLVLRVQRLLGRQLALGGNCRFIYCHFESALSAYGT